MKKKVILSFLVLFFIIPFVLSHDGEEERLDEKLHSLQVPIITIGSIIVAFFVITSLMFPKETKKYKKLFFLAIIIPIIISTLFLAGSTIYINIISETKGPIHWHADFEIWNCNEKLDIIDPTGLSNRVGTPVYHEHNDDRVHVEGTVVELHDVHLSEFFNVIGGELTQTSFKLPTNNGLLEVNNQDLCNGQEGKLQVFVYQITNAHDTQSSNFIYRQIKLDNFEDYVLSPYVNVPPGDCIIVEFSEEKDSTDKLCETYEVQKEQGELILEDGG